MNTLTMLCSLMALSSGLITITVKLRARESEKRFEYAFKPLTMLWLILMVLLADAPFSTTYQLIILLGLLASLGGDICLMLPDDRWFLPGLVSFLLAHIAYIVAFTLESAGTTPIWYIVPFVIYGVVILRWLWGDLGELRAPVLVYVCAIMIMAWQAANRWVEVRDTATLLAMIGAYLFVTSDSVLAVERFRGSWRSAPFWVLSTYFTAQWLIALSVVL